MSAGHLLFGWRSERLGWCVSLCWCEKGSLIMIPGRLWVNHLLCRAYSSFNFKTHVQTQTPFCILLYSIICEGDTRRSMVSFKLDYGTSYTLISKLQYSFRQIKLNLQSNIYYLCANLKATLDVVLYIYLVNTVYCILNRIFFFISSTEKKIVVWKIETFLYYFVLIHALLCKTVFVVNW